MEPLDADRKPARPIVSAAVAALVAGVAAYAVKEFIGAKFLWGNTSLDVQRALGLKTSLTIAALVFLFVYRSKQQS
jgi:hypothetical protein